jgi:hypothetical protein
MESTMLRPRILVKEKHMSCGNGAQEPTEIARLTSGTADPDLQQKVLCDGEAAVAADGRACCRGEYGQARQRGGDGEGERKRRKI